MGIAYKLSCHRCGYESDLLYLGQGMAMLPEQIVGTCTCCDNLTTISINESYGVCSLCGAKDRVIFTSYQHEARPRNPCYLEKFQISMPKMPCLQYGASGSTGDALGLMLRFASGIRSTYV